MHGTTRGRLIGAAAVLALVLGGCAGDDGESADTPVDTAASEDGAGDDEDTSQDSSDEDAPAEPDEDEADEADEGAADQDEMDDGDEGEAGDAGAATVAVTSSDLGDIVVDGEGRTLYMFVPDEGGEPTCTGDCAAAWPVFEGPATAGDGADDALLSTATHPSGATQVTYGGWPLYYFASDAAPGDVNGQGVNDVWFVIGPDGEPIRGDDASASGGDDGY